MHGGLPRTARGAGAGQVFAGCGEASGPGPSSQNHWRRCRRTGRSRADPALPRATEMAVWVEPPGGGGCTEPGAGSGATGAGRAAAAGAGAAGAGLPVRARAGCAGAGAAGAAGAGPPSAVRAPPAALEPVPPELPAARWRRSGFPVPSGGMPADWMRAHWSPMAAAAVRCGLWLPRLSPRAAPAGADGRGRPPGLIPARRWCSSAVRAGRPGLSAAPCIGHCLELGCVGPVRLRPCALLRSSQRRRRRGRRPPRQQSAILPRQPLFRPFRRPGCGRPRWPPAWRPLAVPRRCR